MDNNTIAILAIALTAGLSVALVAWAFTNLVTDVPSEDRTWNDTPPIGFLVVWWPIQWVAHYIKPLISEKLHNAYTAKLTIAGLDYALNPSQFMASRVVWALLFAAVFYIVADLLKLESLWIPAFGFVLGFFYPAIWLKDVIELRRKQMIKTLPFYLDLITLCVESGLNFNGALQQSIAKGPAGVLKDEFSRILRDIRAGSSRTEALRSMSDRLNHASITSFISTVIQAEATGMSLGPILRAQAEQRRDERFTHAEKIAMEAPVKLLFPLIFFIMPCVFAILLFPIIMKIMAQGF